MHPIKQYLKEAGRTILARRFRRALAIAVLAIMAYLFVYLLSVLLIREMSLTWNGIAWIPFTIILGFLVYLPWQWHQFRGFRKVARHLENKNPHLQFSVSSSLDFLDGRSDREMDPAIQELYTDQVMNKVEVLDLREPQKAPWGRYALMALLVNVLFWNFYSDDLIEKFYNPKQSFGQTHLNLADGSITIFEPDYTQIPGRTLTMKPGTFHAYPGSRIRFLIQVPEKTEELFLVLNEEEPVPMRSNNEGLISHEFVLLEHTELRFLISEKDGSGRTSPYIFETKVDDAPEVVLRSNTPEGPINELDPLIIEVEVKDDFGAKELHAVVTFGSEEKRIEIPVPANRRKHFFSKNQWYVSDFDLGDADSFSIYLEAKDNKPIGDPGIGQSAVLTYELESPEKKYDEFMELAKTLLDTMTHTLGDNLDTEFEAQLRKDNLAQAESLGKQIGNGLYASLNITNKLISKVRETPSMTRLDQGFLYKFRNGISSQARERTEIGILYSNLQYRQAESIYRKLVNQHRREEGRVEGLTYDLLLQLKMWAILEMERNENELNQDLDQLDELLENAENMDQDELMKLFNKLMDEVMKDMEKMMAQAAEQMDMTMSEFMNNDAMDQEQFKDLREQIMEALREGDIEKAKKLMEQMKAAMQEQMKAMQQSIGEMSPEMQAMQQNMRELMGLLRELKTNEETLERDTQALKREIDREMGGNQAQMSEAQKKEHQKATQKIHEKLTKLYNELVGMKTDKLVQEAIENIAKQRAELEEKNPTPAEANRIRRDIAHQERLVDFLTRQGLDQLQNMTLRGLDQTEKMQEYLDQNELMLALETGLKLETSLVHGERMSDQTPTREMPSESPPAETFRESREELYKILEALQNMRNNLENRRQQYMQSKGEQRQQKLAQQQQDLQQMIQEFMKKAEDSFGGTEITQKLQGIEHSMRQAEQKLRNANMEGGIQNEQAALQKIGEMMEQMQQSQRPGGRRPQMMMGSKQQHQRGDPSLEDIYIPESQKKAKHDQMKDAIRRQLKKNLPESYGKEIRKYYEKLMDQ